MPALKLLLLTRVRTKPTQTAAHQTEISRLEGVVATTKYSLEAKTKELQASQSDVTQLGVELADLRAQLEAASESAARDAESALRTLNAQKEAHSKAMSEASAQTRSAVAEAEASVQEVAQLQAKVTDLEGQLASAMNKYNQSQSSLVQLRKNALAHTQAMHKVNEEKGVLKAQLATAQDEAKTAQSDAERYRKSGNTLKRKFDELTASTTEQQNELRRKPLIPCKKS